jgi:CMP-2-keto-3-deoxyoctulosonic acid synthetase
MEQSAETLQATNPEVTAALAKLQQTNALLTKELADVTAALAELMNNPVFQQELVLQAKLKSPFGDKEAVNQELAALRASADYKKIAPQRDELMAKKELLEKALAVLGKGVGKQLAFTAKAIPYAWNQWQDMKNYPPAE